MGIFAANRTTHVARIWSVHPTCHNPNTPPPATPLVSGPVIRTKPLNVGELLGLFDTIAAERQPSALPSPSP
jgi:hypothetical protein